MDQISGYSKGSGRRPLSSNKAKSVFSKASRIIINDNLKSQKLQKDNELGHEEQVQDIYETQPD